MKTIKDAKQLSEKEKAVADYLESIGVKFIAYAAGAGLNRDGWTCDGWRAEFRTGKACEQFDYYTGTGLRVIANPESYRRLAAELKTYNPRCIAAKQVRNRMSKHVKPFPPCAASVLHSLLLDASASDEWFADWCDNYGYDSDSIKALNTYNACCENAKRLARIFNREQIEKLSELLQDY